MPPDEQSPTAIVDNGAGLLKVSLFHPQSQKEPTTLTVPNALSKPGPGAIPPPSSVTGKSRRPPGYLVAGEIKDAPDVSSMLFRRPHDRGILSLFDVQRDVWASAFSADRGLGILSKEIPSLLLTEPLGVPVRVRHATDQLVFEKFSFSSYATAPPQRLAAATTAPRGPASRYPTCLVLDSGFSSTTAVPIVNGLEVSEAARRLSLGGKALTNLLKQLISFRSWNMSDETAVINAVKERCCFVAANYVTALDTFRSNSPLCYVLPDPARFADPFGHIQQPNEERDSSDQLLFLRNERIAIPEALFNPSDIGLEQAGVAELVAQTVQACDESVRPDLLANIVLTGGNIKFAGFRDRFVKELRPLISSEMDINIHLDDDPIQTTVQGGALALRHNSIPLQFVTREHYNEVGSDALLREIYEKSS